MSREKTQEWEEGDVNVTLSQCSDCKNNEDINACKIFVGKPTKYAINVVTCPKKEKV
jgi:hypothetical protein